MDLSPWREESPASAYNTVTLLQQNNLNKPVGYFQDQHQEDNPFDTFNVNSIFSHHHPRRNEKTYPLNLPYSG